MTNKKTREQKRLQDIKEGIEAYSKRRQVVVETQKPQLLKENSLIVDLNAVFGVETEISGCPMCSQNVINQYLVLISKGGVA